MKAEFRVTAADEFLMYHHRELQFGLLTNRSASLKRAEQQGEESEVQVSTPNKWLNIRASGAISREHTMR